MTRALVSRRVLTSTGIRPAAIVIEGETIARLDDPDAADLQDVEDVGDALVMPGLVDCHVHINEPGRTQWEGFATATRAAAAGGVTSLVDMPLNCDPVTTTVDALKTKLDALGDQLSVDVGFWGGVVPGNEDQLIPLAEAGVLGSKAFLCHSGIDDFPNVTREDLERAMPRMAEAGVPLLAHAELDLGDPPCPDSATDYASWLRSRPAAWEDAAIALLIELCRVTGCAVHVVHLSSAGAVPMLRDARAEGLPITVETCPHYLCLSAENVPDGDTTYKCAPPIREESNREKLWEALAEGVIDFVISDHSPCTPGLKEGGFGAAWGGIASLSLGLNSVWTEARKRGFPVEQIAEWMCAAPAKFAGIDHRKGLIAPGMDADFCVWDPDAEVTIEESRLHFRHPISPYLGRRARGEILATWLRGRKIYASDERGFDEHHGRPLLHRGRA